MRFMRSLTMQRMLNALRATPFHPQWLLPSRRWVESLLKPMASGRVLDIGCANRWIAHHVDRRVHYIGLDYPATGASLYLATPDVFADAATLPIASNSVEVVVMLEVLEHLERPSDAMLEAARVLRSDGTLLMSMPFLYPVHDAPHDFQRYTEFGLRREASSAGLDIVSLEPALDAIRSAGLLACLAIAGVARAAIAHRMLLAPIMLPLAGVAILLINVLAWFGSKLLPSWPALTMGYRLVARKRHQDGRDGAASR